MFSGFAQLCLNVLTVCLCVLVAFSVGGLVLLDGVASVPGYGAELAQHSGGEGPSH